MKNIFLLVISVTYIFIANAQKRFACVILDSLTKQPLTNTAFTIIQNKQLYYTNQKGCVIFNKLNTDSVTLQNNNYIAKNIVLNSNNENIIYLQKKPSVLTSVTINSTNFNTYNKVSDIDALLKPIQTSQDALRNVPGLFIAQHAGGGKAEQIFLRGFDIDHGTDINISVDGIPVNMISHAHGQGYADLHFLIPETIDKIHFDKGPYNAEKGNLATAGYVQFNTKNSIENNSIKLEAASYNTKRISGLFKLYNRTTLHKKEQLYIAGETFKSKGYFESPQNFTRNNLFAKYFFEKNNKTNFTITTSTFTSKWKASGQIPERAVTEKLISNYGYIDNKEGGLTNRSNFTIQLQHKISANTSLNQSTYLSTYNFSLFSNFTFYLQDSINGDMINQGENRNILGYSVNLKNKKHFNKITFQNELGIGCRNDYIGKIYLANAPNNTITNYIQNGSLKEKNYYVYYNNNLITKHNFNINTSVRYDYFSFSYKNNLTPNNDFKTINKSVISPKIQLQYLASNTLQLFFKNGFGFHSNDTRVILQNTTNNILPKVFGTDAGVQWKASNKLFIQTAIWHLYSQQEFVYVGDAGIVEPSGRSRRIGLDVLARYAFTKNIFADIDINLTKARSIDENKGNNYIPLAPSFTSIGGITAKLNNHLNSGLRYRAIANRPANEDNSIKAKGYFLLDNVTTYQYKKFNFQLTIENITNQFWKEAQFLTESKLKNETLSVSEIHFTPGTPIFFKLGVSYSF